MTTLKASQARIPADTFNRVAYQRQRVRIERRGGRPIYLVSEEDLVHLEELEDRYWAEEGGKALREFEKSGQKPVPSKKVKKELGNQVLRRRIPRSSLSRCLKTGDEETGQKGA